MTPSPLVGLVWRDFYYQCSKMIPLVKGARLVAAQQCRAMSSFAAPVLKSTLNPMSPEYKENSAVMGKLIDQLRERVSTIQQGGDAQARERHTSKGKLMVRDRINGLVDPGTAFLELSPLAGYEM